MRRFNYNNFLIFLIILITLFSYSFGWWMMAQMSASKFPTNYCNAMPGLSRRQRSLCYQNPEAVRAIHKGLRSAVDECKSQFAHERWNCSVADGLGLALKVASAEVAYLYAITAGGASHAVARECAKGTVSDCSCGANPRKKGSIMPLSPVNKYDYGQNSLIGSAAYYTPSSFAPANSVSSTKDFTWAGCSDNVKYGNAFSRKFIDSTEKQHMDARALMNLHNNRVGRKVLASNMRRQCKCHGVSGSCVTKTCWSVVPSFEEYGQILKKKYQKAQQVMVVPDSIELMVRNENIDKSIYSNVRSERDDLKRSYLSGKDNSFMHYKMATSPANRGNLVFLDPSPDYCNRDEAREVQGTSGRECFFEAECTQLCCGRGWYTKHEFRQEPCRCKFIWCCDVKCDTCIREVERLFCK